MPERGASTTDRIEEISALLARTEAAHGVYERAELNGVYDTEWPQWYATRAVELGIGDIVGRSITAAELAVFLVACWAEFERTEPRPSEPWATYTARRLAADA
jgi:hypothetical protein